MNRVTTLVAGCGTGTQGYRNGKDTRALFHAPHGIAVNTVGDIIVADSHNNRIRKITVHGQVTTVAGSGSSTFGDGQNRGAHFHNPCGVAVNEEGLIFVADTYNHCIRTITPEGVVTTLAGSGVSGFSDGPGTQARFQFPRQLAIDHDGNIIVADTRNHRVRVVTQAGQVTTLAGSGNPDFGDGDGNLAHFNQPAAVAVDCNGSIIVADSKNRRIRKISSGGVVTTVAGNGSFGDADGPGASASFYNPSGLAIDGNGNIIVADCVSVKIRMVSSDGNVTSISGCESSDFGGGNNSTRLDRFGIMIRDLERYDYGLGSFSSSSSSSSSSTSILLQNDGFADEEGREMCFGFPHDVVVDRDGNIIVSDYINNCIQKIAANLTPPLHVKLPPRLVSTHASNMSEMLDDPTFADVVFRVGETDMSAHKAVLVSSCAYFKIMFASGFMEGKCYHGGAVGAAGDGATIAIGETTASAFKALLRYIYTDVLEFDDDDVLNVMAKAKEMQIERLYNYTIWYCQQHVCVDNAVLWLIQADEFKLEHLRELTFRFLLKNFGAVRDAAGDSGSGSTLELLQEKPVLLMEIMLAITVEGHAGIISNKRRRVSALTADGSP